MENESRYKLAYATLILAFFMLFLFIVLAMCKCTSLEAKEVMNAVLPLIATWVGAIIAFYFGKENFEAAQQQINKLLDKDTLDDIPVKNVMIHFSTMVARMYEPEKKLSEYRDFLKSVYKSRLPLIDDKRTIKYIIHSSELNEIINENKEITLKELLESEKYKAFYGHNMPKGFITVHPNETMETALKGMNKLDNCQDIFVTENGEKDGKLLGWVTNTLASNFLNLKG